MIKTNSHTLYFTLTLFSLSLCLSISLSFSVCLFIYLLLCLRNSFFHQLFSFLRSLSTNDVLPFLISVLFQFQQSALWFNLKNFQLQFDISNENLVIFFQAMSIFKKILLLLLLKCSFFESNYLGERLQRILNHLKKWRSN